MPPLGISLVSLAIVLLKIMLVRSSEDRAREFGVISAYGPGSERSEEEIEEFWTELSECVVSFGRTSRW